LSRISTNTRVIAVVMPNTQACSANAWTYYKVSVDSIESLTGYNFLSNVPTEIQNVIEARVDN
ncbi:MAG TPA: DNA/RNA non-specific endonuclease, partial [Tenuifilaceae bacterium]|nr:DNA/RNA non-specific endonuclease [Tenuifilaceae bacterium]